MSKDVDLEAVKLLEHHDYQWDPLLLAFRRRRRVGEESTEHYLAQAPVVISYEELSDHGLTEPNTLPLSTHQKEQALKWLRDRIKEQER